MNTNSRMKCTTDAFSRTARKDKPWKLPGPSPGSWGHGEKCHQQMSWTVECICPVKKGRLQHPIITELVQIGNETIVYSRVDFRADFQPFWLFIPGRGQRSMRFHIGSGAGCAEQRVVYSYMFAGTRPWPQVWNSMPDLERNRLYNQFTEYREMSVKCWWNVIVTVPTDPSDWWYNREKPADYQGTRGLQDWNSWSPGQVFLRVLRRKKQGSQ